MRTKGSAQVLLLPVLLSWALTGEIACRHSNEHHQEPTRSQNGPVANDVDNHFVFIALINDDNIGGVAELVRDVLRSRGIQSSMEGGGEGLSITVRNKDVETAVRAIASAPQLKGKGIAVKKDLLYLVNGKVESQRVPKPFVVIAYIKSGTSKEFAESILLELLKRDSIAPTIESEGAGFRISVSQDEVAKAVKAIAAPPDLREKGVIIKEQYLPLLK